MHFKKWTNSESQPGETAKSENSRLSFEISQEKEKGKCKIIKLKKETKRSLRWGDDWWTCRTGEWKACRCYGGWTVLARALELILFYATINYGTLGALVRGVTRYEASDNFRADTWTFRASIGGDWISDFGRRDVTMWAAQSWVLVEYGVNVGSLWVIATWPLVSSEQLLHQVSFLCLL